MSVLILDPYEAKAYRERHEANGANTRDEVWEGMLVVPPLANNEHQLLVQRLSIPFSSIIDWDAGEQTLPGANVSDRDQDWTQNYRGPDIVVYLSGNPAVNRNTHWIGGPDLAVEIISPGEDPHAKLDFYAKVNTRELLIVDRDPWLLELYQLHAGKLRLPGRRTLRTQPFSRARSYR